MERFSELATTPEIRALLAKRNYPAEIWERYLLANWNQGFEKEERNLWTLGQLQFEERLIKSQKHYTPETHSRIAMHLGDTEVLFGQGSLTVEVPYINEKDIERLCSGISEKVADVWKSQRRKPIELFAVLNGLDYFELGKYPPQLLAPFSKTMRESISDPNYQHKSIGYFCCDNSNEFPPWWFPPRESKGVRLLFEHKP